ncbi:DNA-binding protein HU [Pseudazoarcus pumilus]|uniref:DNA-binding protein HU n=2 Tax=Pseudazoarcus pumilus TaxID=2067960 RepID=A0A2I6S9F9_9RHOO|nr:DNA-binding protein HU [Pseudazoarcus pumilus]
MNKTELIERVAARTALSKARVAEVLDAQRDVLVEALHEEGEAVLPGLGKIKAAPRAARTARNPRTGDPVQIPERIAARFSAGKALVDALNL